MVAVTPLCDADVSPGALRKPALGARGRAVLDQMRQASLACRTASRGDLFKACALLSLDRAVAGPAHAEALVKCVTQALGRPPKLLRPGVAEVTFDEAWLAGLAETAARGDEASFAFLLKSRIAPEHRRAIAFLSRSIARSGFAD